MAYDKRRNETKEPSLAEMTAFAINFLSKVKNDKGFLLFVEGGRIDHGHHASRAQVGLKLLDYSLHYAVLVCVSLEKANLLRLSELMQAIHIFC